MKYKKVFKGMGIVLAVVVVAIIIVQVFSSSFNSNNRGLESGYGGVTSYDSVSINSGRSQKMVPSAPSMGMMEAEESLMVDDSYGDGSEAPFEKKIIREGNLTLRVEGVDTSVVEITSIVKKYQGEVFATNFSQSGNNVKSGNVVVKVPVGEFEEVFVELKTVADIVLRESSTGQDVTEQYTDLQARLKNKQAEEGSFVKLLDQAIKMDDVLKVTKELSRVRGEIERLQGQIRLLDSRTDMSTIHIYLSEDTNITVIDTWRPWQEMKESVNGLLKGLQGFVSFIIIFVIQVLPMLMVYGVLLLVIFFVGKKIYKRTWKK